MIKHTLYRFDNNTTYCKICGKVNSNSLCPSIILENYSKETVILQLENRSR